MHLRLVSLGFGNVARALVSMLEEKGAELRARHALTFSFTGALTRRGGGFIAEEGLSPAALAASGWPQGPLPGGARTFEGEALELVARCPADVVLELTALSPLDGQPALDHVRAALSAGRHVVTANKGPIAHGLRELRGLARTRGLGLRFESTVMDGTPLFGLVEACLPVTELASLRGVLNSTSNFVLSRMVEGVPLEEALAEAQRLGIAEADPRYDLEGWDASVKAAVLANALWDAELRPVEVERRELGAEAMSRVVASGAGRAVKQVVELERRSGIAHAQVRLEALEPGDVFASLRGMETALLLRTDTMGELTLVEGEGGPGQTAFGILADLLAIARGALGG